MLIHDRRKELGYQIAKLESNPSGDYSAMGPDIGLMSADIDIEGNLVGRRNWRIKERTGRGVRKFGTTVRDNWVPGIGAAGGGATAIWGVNEAFAMLPEVHWIIPAVVGGFAGWKGGEWSNQAVVKAISLIGRPFRAFNERYYFKL